MSQPFDQLAEQEALGALDVESGEFWMTNPWEAGDHNLSAFERNGVLLNVGDGKFVDISHLSSADLESDSRSVVAEDLNGDGMPDLIIRNNGGGPLVIFENRFPQTHWLKVSLRGVKSNSRGIGAKLELHVDGRTLHRELQPHNSFASQQSTIVHFGLDKAATADKLTIRWPSGEVQTFTDIAADRHLIAREGEPSLVPFGR